MPTVALLQETIIEYTTGFPKITHHTLVYANVALAQQALQRIACNLSDKFANSQSIYTDIYTDIYTEHQESPNSFHIENDDLAYDLQVERQNVKNKAH